MTDVPTQRDLSPGDTGPDVEWVQKVLNLPIDGEYGPQTEAGVRGFQGGAGLPKDGVVGAVTWAALETLEAARKGGTDGISDVLAAAIDDTVDEADIDISWSDRGTPESTGFYAGMAKTFALALLRLEDNDPAANIMAEAQGDPDEDALAWYESEFADEGMDNSRAGPDTLRHLFVMMVGLAMRESSGNSWCGRDMSASNTSSTTAEAGLLQTSYNISTFSSQIPLLLEQYKHNPNGFHPSFGENLSPSVNDLDTYGSGDDGAAYQFLSKYAPAMHVLITAIGMRRARTHWGPIGRREVDIRPEIDDMLYDVQKLVEQGMPEPAPDEATVAIKVRTSGNVRVIVNDKPLDG